MRLSLLSALALSLSPSVARSWSLGPSFYSLTTPMLLQSPSSLVARQRAMADRMIEQTNQMLRQQGNQLSYPRYDLVDDDTKFQLSIDVPGVKMEDIDITLEEGYLTVRGQRVASDDNSKFMSKFSQTFALDTSVDVDKISASLDHGVLVVTAPKDMKKLEENVRKIPIMMGSSSSSSLPSSNNIASEASSSVSTSLPVSSDEDVIDLDDDKVDGLKEAVEMKNKGEEMKEKELMGGEF